MAALSLHLLGPFEAESEGIPLTRFRTKSVQALLIDLACHQDQTLRCDGIMAPQCLELHKEPAQADLQER